VESFKESGFEAQPFKNVAKAGNTRIGIKKRPKLFYDYGIRTNNNHRILNKSTPVLNRSGITLLCVLPESRVTG